MITFLKSKFQRTYTFVKSKVVFITSKVECEATSLAIKYVKLKVFNVSKAEREATNLAIRHVTSKVECKSRLQVNDDKETHAQCIYLGTVSIIYSRVSYSRSVQLRNIGAIYLSL